MTRKPKPPTGTGPCSRNWDELGTGPRRFCTDCHKTVHDLDALTAAEVARLRRENPDGFCGTFIPDENGEFREKPLAPIALPSHLKTAAAAMLAATLMSCSESASAVPAPGDAPVQEAADGQALVPGDGWAAHPGSAAAHPGGSEHQAAPGNEPDTLDQSAADEATLEDCLGDLRYLGYLR